MVAGGCTRQYVRLCAGVCGCVSGCVSVCVRVAVCARVHVCFQVHTLGFVSVHRVGCVFTLTYRHACVCMCLCVCVFVHVSVCVSVRTLFSGLLQSSLSCCIRAEGEEGQILFRYVINNTGKHTHTHTQAA